MQVGKFALDSRALGAGSVHLLLSGAMTVESVAEFPAARLFARV
jgi:hypothetical protein